MPVSKRPPITSIATTTDDGLAHAGIMTRFSDNEGTITFVLTFGVDPFTDSPHARMWMDLRYLTLMQLLALEEWLNAMWKKQDAPFPPELKKVFPEGLECFNSADLDRRVLRFPSPDDDLLIRPTTGVATACMVELEEFIPVIHTLLQLGIG